MIILYIMYIVSPTSQGYYMIKILYIVIDVSTIVQLNWPFLKHTNVFAPVWEKCYYTFSIQRLICYNE